MHNNLNRNEFCIFMQILIFFIFIDFTQTCFVPLMANSNMEMNCFVLFLRLRVIIFEKGTSVVINFKRSYSFLKTNLYPRFL